MLPSGAVRMLWRSACSLSRGTSYVGADFKRYRPHCASSQSGASLKRLSAAVANSDRESTDVSIGGNGADGRESFCNGKNYGSFNLLPHVEPSACLILNCAFHVERVAGRGLEDSNIEVSPSSERSEKPAARKHGRIEA